MKVTNTVGWGLFLIPMLWMLSSHLDSNEIANLVVALLFKRDNPKTIAEISITQPPTLLGSWAAMVKVFRQSLHSETPPSSVNELVTFYTPAIILAAIVFLCAFILLFASLSMCVNSCCCKNRLRKKYEKMQPPGFAKALCAKILFGIPPIIILFMIAIHILASNALTDTLASLEVSTNSVIGNTFALINDAAPAIGTLLDSMAVNVNNSILTAKNSVDFDVFTSTVNPPMNRVISALREVERDKRFILGNSTQIDSGRENLNTNTSSLTTQVNSINSNVAILFGVLVNSSTSQSYQVDNPSSAPVVPNRATAMAIAASQAPNTTSIFSPLRNSADLNVTATDAEQKLSNAVADAKNTIDESTLGIGWFILGPMYSATVSLQDTKLTVANQLNNLTSALSLNDAYETVDAGFDQANSFDKMRLYGQLAFVLVYMIPLVLITVSGVSKKPGYMKAINLVCVPYYLLIYMLGFVFLLLTLVFGDVCYYGFEAPGQLAPLAGPEIYGTFNSTGAAIDACYQGKSLLQAVASTGIFNLDIVEQANTAFADVNFGEIGTIDLNGTLSSDPSGDATNSTSVSLGGMTVAPFAEINLSCEALQQDLASLKLVLESVTPNDLNDTTQFSDWQTKLAPVLTEIDSAMQRNLLIRNHSTDLSTAIVNTNNTAKSMMNTSYTIAPAYAEAIIQIELFAASASANISVAIPKIKTQILAELVYDAATFHNRLNCSAIANDFINFRQGVCGDFMTSLDGFWSTLVILALMALLSLPATGGSDPDVSGRKGDSVLKPPAVDKDIGKMKFDQPMQNIVKTQELSPAASTPQIMVNDDDDKISPGMVRSASQGTIQKAGQSFPMDRKNSAIPGRANYPAQAVFKNPIDAQTDFAQFSYDSGTPQPNILPPQDNNAFARSFASEIPQGRPSVAASVAAPKGHQQDPSFVIGENQSITVRSPVGTSLAIPGDPSRSRSQSQGGGGQQAFRQSVIRPSVSRSSVAMPQYDPLEVLAEKFNMPELHEVALTMTVEQVSLMDVLEAEQAGITRDSYFKLKRYFISKRKL